MSNITSKLLQLAVWIINDSKIKCSITIYDDLMSILEMNLDPSQSLHLRADALRGLGDVEEGGRPYVKRL